LSYSRTSRAGARLRWAGLFGLIAALSLALTPGVADAAKKKKKKDTVKVLSYNLYLGSDLADATNAGLASRTDLFADEVGEVLNEVQANDFNVRAQTIAGDIKKNKVDLVGLQEAALWRLQFPTDGGGPPRGAGATTPLIDYIDTLLAALNNKAKTKKQCKKKGLKGKKCYRGYKLLVAQQEADVEQFGDFDGNAGPDGTTFDISNSASLGAAAPGRWLEGNDDFGINLAEPPAAQCSDGIDNDGDTLIDYGPTAGTHETGGPSAGDASPGTGIQGGAPPWGCDSRVDNDETADAPGADASSLPQDANFDHHALAGNFGSPDEATPPCPGFPAPSANCPTAVSYDTSGFGLDAPGVVDCNPSVPGPQDTSEDAGPTQSGPPPGWPFAGYDGDQDAEHDGAQVPVCMFHGIDGDNRLTMRDAILVRKGANIKTSNVTSGNFSPASTFSVTVFGQPLPFSRGWVAADVNVRGKRFRLVNTHLESEDAGTVREDQASELIAPGGPATPNPTVLIGDLNSDPNLGASDPESPPAFLRLMAAGFRSLAGPALTGGHGELLNDFSNVLDGGRIDHILTNSASIGFTTSQVLDSQGGGLWASDHGGVLSRLLVPGKQKKKK
jgi:endonuclease/exonuclease/phosphatase family metal-dependent hydrolase